MNQFETISQTSDLNEAFKRLGYSINQPSIGEEKHVIKPLSSVFTTAIILIALSLFFIPSLAYVLAYFTMETTLYSNYDLPLIQILKSFLFGVSGVILLTKGINRLLFASGFKIEITDQEVNIHKREDFILRRNTLKNPTGLKINKVENKIFLYVINQQEKMLLLEDEYSDNTNKYFHQIKENISFH